MDNLGARDATYIGGLLMDNPVKGGVNFMNTTIGWSMSHMDHPRTQPSTFLTSFGFQKEKIFLSSPLFFRI
jgi:hypothetical protein